MDQLPLLPMLISRKGRIMRCLSSGEKTTIRKKVKALFKKELFFLFPGDLDHFHSAASMPSP